MVDVLDQRVTRSKSNERLARARASQQADSSAGVRGTTVDDSNSYHQLQQLNPNFLRQGQLQDLQQSVEGVNEGVSIGRDSTYHRNTSEEMFLNNLMNAVPGTPIMEAASLEFLDSLQLEPPPPQTPRGNSEELLRCWIATNPENSNQNRYGVFSGSFSTESDLRQHSRSGLQATIAQQNGAFWVSRGDNVEQLNFQTNSFISEDGIAGDMPNIKANLKPQRNNLLKDKASATEYSSLGPLKNMLLSANSPMTRSRSSELRRKLLEGQQVLPSADAIHKPVTDGTPASTVSPPMSSTGVFTRVKNGISKSEPESKPKVVLAQPLSSSAPANDNQQIWESPAREQRGHLVSDVVGLLKGSIERKKLQQKQQELQAQKQQPQVQRIISRQGPISPPQGDPRQDELPDGPQDLMQQIRNEIGQVQQKNLGHTQSPTTSAALSHSAGKVTSDGPTNSGMSPHRQSLKRGNGEIYENGVAKTEMVERADRLTRAGSINSSLKPEFHLKEIDGATKKRRVERQRKMAEAKGRGAIPQLPADLQAVMKRCDALEKEVRSLKLNLSFMNRKDSEQTKKIEELEHQNEDLRETKNRLLVDLERVSGKHGTQLLDGRRIVGNW